MSNFKAIVTDDSLSSIMYDGENIAPNMMQIGRRMSSSRITFRSGVDITNMKIHVYGSCLIKVPEGEVLDIDALSIYSGYDDISSTVIIDGNVKVRFITLHHPYNSPDSATLQVIGDLQVTNNVLATELAIICHKFYCGGDVKVKRIDTKQGCIVITKGIAP